MWRRQGKAACRLSEGSVFHPCTLKSWTITPASTRSLSYADIPRTKDALPLIGNTYALLKDLPNFHRLLESYSKEADIIKVKKCLN